ncbi:MAG TPA: B12-binding domain-containing radical SAM protein [Lachnoclostridium phytofermentans]|uniref:B12-binding domain-containing radical SAM protein n=1 Tax=Lachnoclostridium phytofermentans TaxID=66219 RepID=A0A3D2XAP6_9FIRM|nr:radical SAM protein [Lachnoclostridium sp.]HCL03817.1 B12-binding domain-containing radical SAM protein [Lachnoclostridium phytofermentans]
MYVKLIQPKMEKRPMDTEIKIHMAPPLGLLTIATILRESHRISIENENIQAISFDDNPDIVGITVTVDVLPRAIEISDEFRKRGISVVAGGIHITTAASTIPDGSFDVLCIGMAEGTWPYIMQDFADGCLKSKYICSGKLTGQDIVSPAYDLIDSDKYLYCNVVHTSRGCPYRCDFCYNSSASRRYINRPVQDVMNEISALKSRHIMFIDDNFIGNPTWTRALLKELKPMRLKWNAAVSANILEMSDLLDEMKESGCQSLFIGFESINPGSLQDVHKKQNVVNKYEELVNAIHSRGIMINASFVFGLDSDTSEIFQSTLDWIVLHKIETVTSHILTPYPGTALYERMKSEGRIITSDLSLYNTAHVVFTPTKMTEEELYQGYLWIYRKVYSFKNIIMRMPKSKNQILPYLAFNLFYRKFGKFTDILCKWISYKRIGHWGQIISKYNKNQAMGRRKNE